jgi:hypothetical protein
MLNDGSLREMYDAGKAKDDGGGCCGSC